MRPCVVRSLQLVQVFQSCEYDLFAGFFDLSREEHFIENRVDLYTVVYCISQG